MVSFLAVALLAFANAPAMWYSCNPAKTRCVIHTLNSPHRRTYAVTVSRSPHRITVTGDGRSVTVTNIGTNPTRIPIP